MSDFEESPNRSRRKPSKLPKNEPRNRSNSRFSRLVAACGMSHVEAADYLDLSKQSIAMKAAGLRPMFKEEEGELVTLWKRINDFDARLDSSFPAGCRRMQHALWELRNLLALREGRAIPPGINYDIELDENEYDDTEQLSGSGSSGWPRGKAKT